MARAGTRRVVVITGANEGIGHGILRALVESGYRVACFDIDDSNVRSLADRYPSLVTYVDCDVTEDGDVDAAVETVLEEWGQIDVLVNNAAVFTFGAFVDRSIDDIRHEFEVNYFGYVRTIQAVLPHMLDRGTGIIHNVSSGAGIVGHPGLAGYSSTKGAIEALVRSLRLELRDENVSVTVMHPPLSNTRSADRIGYPERFLSDPAAVGEKLAGKIESTDRVIYADLTTRIGLWLSKRFPVLVRRGTARFVDSLGRNADE